jgi:hypothetical protein
VTAHNVSTIVSSNIQKQPPICRNCGQDGHLHCKRIFTEEERKLIKAVVIGKFEERLKSAEETSKYKKTKEQLLDIQAEVGSERYERIQKQREEGRRKSKDPERRARERKKRQQYVQVPENQKKN